MSDSQRRRPADEPPRRPPPPAARDFLRDHSPRITSICTYRCTDDRETRENKRRAHADIPLHSDGDAEGSERVGRFGAGAIPATRPGASERTATALTRRCPTRVSKCSPFPDATEQ
jgi:hypothetical protein